jgi:hypothetical protein
MRRFLIPAILIACLGLLTTGCCCDNDQPDNTYQGQYKTIWPDGTETYTDYVFEFVTYEANFGEDSDYVGKAPIADSTPSSYTSEPDTTHNAYIIDDAQVSAPVTFIYPPNFDINSLGLNARFEANNFDDSGGDYVTTDIIGPILGLEYEYKPKPNANSEGIMIFYAEFDDRDVEGDNDDPAVTTYRTWFSSAKNTDEFVLSHYKFEGVNYVPYTTGDEVIKDPQTPGCPDGLNTTHLEDGVFPNGLKSTDYTYDPNSKTYKRDSTDGNGTNSWN